MSNPDTYTEKETTVSKPVTKETSYVHKKPLVMKKKPKEPKKGHLQYTTKLHTKSRGWKMYRQSAAENNTDPDVFDEDTIMDTVDKLCKMHGVPQRFPPDERVKAKDFDILGTHRDRYDAHVRYPPVGRAIMFRNAMLGDGTGGMFMGSLAPGTVCTMPYEPAALTILAAKSTAYARGRVHACMEDLIKFMQFSMDPYKFLFDMIDAEIAQSPDLLENVVSPAVMELAMESPLFRRKVEETERAVFSDPFWYDAICRFTELEEDGLWLRAYPKAQTPSFDDPLPGDEGSREAEFSWFGEMPLSDFDDLASIGKIPSQSVPNLKRKRRTKLKIPTTRLGELLEAPDVPAEHPFQAQGRVTKIQRRPRKPVPLWSKDELYGGDIPSGDDAFREQNLSTCAHTSYTKRIALNLKPLPRERLPRAPEFYPRGPWKHIPFTHNAFARRSAKDHKRNAQTTCACREHNPFHEAAINTDLSEEESWMSSSYTYSASDETTFVGGSKYDRNKVHARHFRKMLKSQGRKTYEPQTLFTERTVKYHPGHSSDDSLESSSTTSMFDASSSSDVSVDWDPPLVYPYKEEEEEKEKRSRSGV